MGGRLVSDLQLDQATGAVSAVVSRDREGNQTVHKADAVVFAIGITGGERYSDDCSGQSPQCICHDPPDVKVSLSQQLS